MKRTHSDMPELPAHGRIAFDQPQLDDLPDDAHAMILDHLAPAYIWRVLCATSHAWRATGRAYLGETDDTGRWRLKPRLAPECRADALLYTLVAHWHRPLGSLLTAGLPVRSAGRRLISRLGQVQMQRASESIDTLMARLALVKPAAPPEQPETLWVGEKPELSKLRDLVWEALWRAGVVDTPSRLDDSHPVNPLKPQYRSRLIPAEELYAPLMARLRHAGFVFSSSTYDFFSYNEKLGHTREEQRDLRAAYSRARIVLRAQRVAATQLRAQRARSGAHDDDLDSDNAVAPTITSCTIKGHFAFTISTTRLGQHPDVEDLHVKHVGDEHMVCCQLYRSGVQFGIGLKPDGTYYVVPRITGMPHSIDMHMSDLTSFVDDAVMPVLEACRIHH
jgi:hypothetical protein